MRINTLLKKIVTATKKNKLIKPSHQECIIFGSGPSLDNLNGDSDFLKEKDLIGCNFIHQHHALAGKSFKIFSMIDREYTDKINKAYFQTLDCEYFLVSTKNVYLLDLWCLNQKFINVIPTKEYNTESPKHQIVSGKKLVTGNSIPFLIQCAAFLAGYKTIYLYGVDHFCMNSLKDNKDSNFNNYQGRKVKDLSMTSTKLTYINSLYEFVAMLCKNESVEVINLTPESKLETFKKVSMDGLIKYY